MGKNFRETLNKQMANPEFKAEYDALEPEFQIIQAIVDARNRSGLTHDFTFARPLVVDAAKVQDAVDDDPVEFGFVRSLELFGIGTYRVQTDEQVARNAVSLTVVERDDVGVIIVLQILAVYFQNLFIRTENVSYFTYFFPVSFCNSFL